MTSPDGVPAEREQAAPQISNDAGRLIDAGPVHVTPASEEMSYLGPAVWADEAHTVEIEADELARRYNALLAALASSEAEVRRYREVLKAARDAIRTGTTADDVALILTSCTCGGTRHGAELGHREPCNWLASIARGGS